MTAAGESAVDASPLVGSIGGGVGVAVVVDDDDNDDNGDAVGFLVSSSLSLPYEESDNYWHIRDHTIELHSSMIDD